MSRSALLLIFSQSRGLLPLYFSMCLLKWATYPMETTTLVQTITTGKPTFAVRQNLCRAFYIGRTAKSIFAVRFL
jgi:hypothetical protein